MVHFIKQEAEEKANEISVAAEEVNPEFCFLIRSGKMERKQKRKKKNKTMQMLLGVVVE
jgi:RecA/RadA recombinase